MEIDRSFLAEAPPPRRTNARDPERNPSWRSCPPGPAEVEATLTEVFESADHCISLRRGKALLTECRRSADGVPGARPSRGAQRTLFPCETRMPPEPKGLREPVGCGHTGGVEEFRHPTGKGEEVEGRDRAKRR